jgi:flagellin
MALYINTNSEAIIAQNNLDITEGSLNSAMTDLSSGLRINTAADDAAGYAISEDLTSQVNGLDQSENNAQDATSLVQTADGSLNEVTQMLQRIRELAVEYNGGTLDSTDQSSIQGEINQLISQIDQIGNQAQFNGISLFSVTGSSTATISLASGATETVNVSSITFQIGADDGQSISVSLQQLTGTSGTLAGLGTLSLGSSTVLASLSDMIDATSTLASDFGAVQNRLGYTLDNLSTYSENLTAAQSTIQDVDMASEMTEFTKDQILEQTGIAMLSQAEQNPQAVLKLLGA